MNCTIQARQVADYMNSLKESFCTDSVNEVFNYNHIGALYTDIVLQAGVSYNSVVKPRVENILLKYADYNTLKKFQFLVNNIGLPNILNWKHPIKLKRFEDLLRFSDERFLNDCDDLRLFLLKNENQTLFLNLKGFGPKTLDYLLKLLNVDTIAVDRHVYSFLRLAGLDIRSYQEAKKVVEYAADFLNIRRSSVDTAIWKFMSEKTYLKYLAIPN